MDEIEILRQVGGTEMVALVGAVVEASLKNLPVVLDGFVVTASVAPLEARAGALDYWIAGHRSSEPGHQLLLEKWLESFRQGRCEPAAFGICGVCDRIHSDRDVDGGIFANCIPCAAELVEVCAEIQSDREGE